MRDFYVSTEDKFMGYYHGFTENNNRLMQEFISFQNQLAVDEIRLTATIIFKLGDVLNRLYDFYRIIGIKKACKDSNTVKELTMMNMKIRNENELVFDKLRKGIKNIKVMEIATSLELTLDSLNSFFDATIKVDYDLANYI